MLAAVLLISTSGTPTYAAENLYTRNLSPNALIELTDSQYSYSAYNNATELDFLKDNWTLDDEEATSLHQSRKQALNYMIDIVRDYDLQDSYPAGIWRI